MAHKIYPVEIKVNVAGPAADALSALELAGGSSRQIWFLEDLTPGFEPALPLLAAGVLLRLRRGQSDDSTIKLRPCRRTQLPPEWTDKIVSGDAFEYRVEADWTGERRSLAASAVRELEQGLIGDVTLDGADPGLLFDRRQQDFIRSCADFRVAFGGLTPLGPIEATKWKKVAIGEFETNVERWTVGSLDFLEVSIRSEDNPEQHQHRFESAIRAAGLTIDDSPDSKTRRVLVELTA
ncbi:MAG: hypothetical protein ABWY04_15210 [Arthrobacter sp.]